MFPGGILIKYGKDLKMPVIIILTDCITSKMILDKDQSAVIEKKKEFMDSLKEEIEKGKELTVEFVQKGMEEWRALGVLPHKVKHLDIKFNKVT